jgi:MFS family permease
VRVRHRYNYFDGIYYDVMAWEESMVSEGGGRKTLALVLLCCASFVAVLDLTIVAIALPSVRRELGFGGGDAQWILTGYALSFGGLLLFMGRAGDLYGRRRLFVGGLAMFAAASLLGVWRGRHGCWYLRAYCRV